MARRPRIKMPGHGAVYHVVNRVSHRQFKLGPQMKSYFIELMQQLGGLFYVRYLAFTILDNHYHLLVNFLDPEDVDPYKAMEIWNDYHEDTPYTRDPDKAEDREYVVAQMTDVSSFMKRFNMHMSIHYNWLHEYRTEGTLWQRRFRSSVMERGCAAALCSAYIELNAFRASETAAPEDYPFCSLYHLKEGNPLGLVDTELVAESLFVKPEDTQELYQFYRDYVYREGIEKGEKGLLNSKITELLSGKAVGGEQGLIEIYDRYVNPGLYGSLREKNLKWWLSRAFSKAAGGLKCLCSPQKRSVLMDEEGNIARDVQLPPGRT